MAISANTLFHFTRKYETLINILMSKFYPRLCLESCLLSKDNKKWAVPMVCFCDIPLSNIAQHTQKYGNYAIGIKKDWAIEQGVSPILYVHEKSRIVDQCRDALAWSIERNDVDDVITDERAARLISMFYMMKPYEGVESLTGQSYKIRYYDEREWRYIPPVSNGNNIFLTEDNYNNLNIRDNFNTINERYGVEFNPDAINYIIVEKEDEIVPLIHELSYIKGDFPHKSVELLTSRIISMDRIKEDF